MSRRRQVTLSPRGQDLPPLTEAECTGCGEFYSLTAAGGMRQHRTAPGMPACPGTGKQPKPGTARMRATVNRYRSPESRARWASS